MPSKEIIQKNQPSADTLVGAGRYGAAAFGDVSLESPTKVLTAGAELPHESEDSRMRTRFEVASPRPLSCSAQACESVQLVAAVNGPDIWKRPTRKL